MWINHIKWIKTASFTCSAEEKELLIDLLISVSWVSPILLEELSIKHISACGMGEVWIIFGISNLY